MAVPGRSELPVTLQEQCLDWPVPAPFVPQTQENTGEAEHQGDTSAAFRGSHRRRYTAQGLRHEGTLSFPKMTDPEHVENVHRTTIKNDINFQEHIIATPSQSQTKYFQENTY